LKANPSFLTINPQTGFSLSGDTESDNYQCQIYEQDGSLLLKNSSSSDLISIEGRKLDKNEARRLQSGEKISIISENKSEIIEYVFSSETGHDKTA